MRSTAIPVVSAIFALFAASSCHHDSGSAPTGAPAAAATPTMGAVATAVPHADLGDDELGVIADAEPETGQVPLHVRFTVEMALDEEVENATYTWDFGDGSPPVKQQEPEHTYEKPGQYLATVQVAGGQGHHGWDEVEIEAQPHELPAGEQ
jgi:hypothetical protein